MCLYIMIPKLDSWVIIFISGYSRVSCPIRLIDPESYNMHYENESLWYCRFQVFSRLSDLGSSHPVTTAMLCLCFNLIIAKELHQTVYWEKMLI